MASFKKSFSAKDLGVKTILRQRKKKVSHTYFHTNDGSICCQKTYDVFLTFALVVICIALLKTCIFSIELRKMFATRKKTKFLYSHKINTKNANSIRKQDNQVLLGVALSCCKPAETCHRPPCIVSVTNANMLLY